MPLRRHSLRAIALLAGSLDVVSSGLQAAPTVVIHPDVTVPSWEGWGTSLCWWAHAYGGRSDIADLLFTTRSTAFAGTTLPGLGLNIARYNAGASSTVAIGTDHQQASPNIPLFKQIPAFWLNWFSADPGSASWDWTRDDRQRAALQAAKARGANLFELFSNSPVWWMCYNHNPSGANTGASDNLQSWNYRQHAVHLATIARYAQDHWNIRFDSVEPFNEPVAGWWSATGTQEGCHFDVGTQATVIGFLRDELNARGLSSIRVSASDENSYSDALNTWTKLGSSVRAKIGRVNVHGYEYGNGPRSSLFQATAGTRLWNSEYGEGDASGLSLARNLGLDFSLLHPSAWCYWQPLDYGGWGLVQADPSNQWLGAANPKYFVLAHYTRHIRPGLQILSTSDSNSVAAYDPVQRRLVLVTFNDGKAQSIGYDLSGLFGIQGPARTWTTSPTGSLRYRGDGTLSLGTNTHTFSVPFPASTIKTIEIDNVDRIAPPPPLTVRANGQPPQLVFQWPAWGQSVGLRRSGSLKPTAVWEAVPGTPQRDGTNWTLTVAAPSSTPAFYQLQGP
jgi:galactan endo-1,6-beta-galactosidase